MTSVKTVKRNGVVFELVTMNFEKYAIYADNVLVYGPTNREACIKTLKVIH